MLEKFKISVRISILTLFTMLLISVSVATAIIDYRTTKNILFLAGKKILQQTSVMTEHFVTRLFLPGFYLTDHGARLIEKGLIVPGPSREYMMFLLETIRDLPNNSIVAWGDPLGNYYELERSKNQTFLNTILTCHNKMCMAREKYIDINGKSISNDKISTWVQGAAQQLTGTFEPYDPRVRPWYQQAVTSHQPILSDIFLSILFSGSFTLCMNTANPIYALDGKLLGVLAVKTNLQTLSEYIATINLTKNSTVFIADNNGNLVAAKGLTDFSSSVLPKLETLKMPWVLQSWQVFQQQHETLFVYQFNKVDYIAFYHVIPGLRNAKLYIGIITPTSDIVGFLNRELLLSLLVMAIVLGIGALLVWYISNSISRPIIRLADETKAVTYTANLPPSNIKSKIREIIYMQDAFNSMKRTMQSFSRYVPVTLVKHLLARGDIAHVGGESKKLTYLFADVCNFTALAEKFTPQQLMTYLSEYFDVMTKIILNNKGTVDKYIGDGIMAFWGAPVADNKQAEHACVAALEMQAALIKLNEHWRAKGQPQLNFRIGINTGVSIVGNVGSEDRLNYTVLGDSVNLTNRIKDINKQYNTTIIITQSTYQLVKDEFAIRLLDYVAIPGKTEGIYLYELLSFINQFGDRLDQYNQKFQMAFAAYEQKQWSKALDGFLSLAGEFPADNIVAMYVERSRYFRSNIEKSAT